MDTRTLSFADSASISEIVAGIPSKGPSVTVIDSPTSKSTSISRAEPWEPDSAPVAAPPLAGACFSSVGASIEMTSSGVSGTGWWVCPTNPVTPGVWRTTPHDSSVRSIRTRTYPGMRTRLTTFCWAFALTSTTSSIGTSIWKISSSMFKVVMRVWRLDFTRFS